MKQCILFLVMTIGLFSISCSKIEEFKQISTSAENLAIKGYDTVSYFAENGAVKGNPQYEFAWNGAKWLFSSRENMEKFKQNPEIYAPQFGGYCSFAVSHGYTAEGDPEAWKVVDGKLYLNYNQNVKEKWEAEQRKLIEDGNKNWQEFKTKKPQHNN
jgi:YHS domain-containing protein